MSKCVQPAPLVNIGGASPRVATVAHALSRFGALTLAAALGGCSAAIPLPSFIGARNDVTGSIRPHNPISPAMDVEDWRRAKGALALALDPQGNGAPVSWDNPKSGAKGVFTPVGPAMPVGENICRSFVAQVSGSLPLRSLKGAACRDRGGEWSIGDMAPWQGKIG